jgi:hypothetical protein
MSDILWVQNLGNEFGPKMVFLDTLVSLVTNNVRNSESCYA